MQVLGTEPNFSFKEHVASLQRTGEGYEK